MKHLIKLTLLIFLLPLNARSQSFYPGYAIENSGDTIKGYLKFRRWENNPRGTEFKPGAREKTIELTTANTRRFGIDVGSMVEFQRYAGPVSTDGINISDLGSFRDTSYLTDTVFLKVLRKGPNVQLFSYDDNLKTRYFIAEDSQLGPRELVYRIYYKIDSVGVKSTVNEQTYKKQLYALAVKYGKDDEHIQNLIYRSDYSSASIIAIADKINGLTSKDIEPNSQLASPPKVKLVLMSAVLITVAIMVFSVMHK